MRIGLLAGMAIAVGVAIESRRNAAPVALKMVDDNPNNFYLSATGKEFSVRYTYDPHAADLWMFGTAEGKLRSSTNE